VDLAFNKEQEMLKTSAREFLTKNCPRDLVMEMAEDEKGYPPELWRNVAELGWLGLGIPEEYGGTGGNFLEVAALLEEMGRVCFPGPFVPTIIGASILVEAAKEEQKREFLPKIVDGDLILCLANIEEDANYDPASIKTAAVREGDGYVINGTKMFVQDAHVADYMICAARTGADPSGGITLFMVDASSPGLTRNSLKTFAGDKTSQVVFNNVKVSADNVIGEENRGQDYLKNAIAKGAVGMCTQMVGAAEHALELSVEHSKQRVQFGKAIGTFQSIQFQCADALTEVDGSRLIAYQAAWMLAEGLPSAKQVAMAKSWVSDAFSRALQLTVEVHGGQGIMWDENMTLYTKRALNWRTAFGDADYHREAIAREIGM
jgi:alkylation response protein AidB-like acyl-CoA dehydrogenase